VQGLYLVLLDGLPLFFSRNVTLFWSSKSLKGTQRETHRLPPELIQGPVKSRCPSKQGDKSIYKRDTKNWAVGSRVKGER
jgi:hypothetical protein